MRSFTIKAFILLGAIALFILAWESNVGKALACIFAPKVVNVNLEGLSSNGTPSSSSSPSAGPAGPAQPV